MKVDLAYVVLLHHVISSCVPYIMVREEALVKLNLVYNHEGQIVARPSFTPSLVLIPIEGL